MKLQNKISTKSHSLSNNRKIVKLAALITIGLIIFVFESYIPRPLPWLKPGLANIVTLIALYQFGLKEAIIIVFGRVIIGSLVIGTFLSPTFILALGAGIVATFVMALVKNFFSHIFSIFGISISGAIVHNFVQLVLVNILIVNQIQIFYLLPALMISGIFTGFIVAFLSYYLLAHIQKYSII